MNNMNNDDEKNRQIAELEQIVKETEARLNQAKAMLGQVSNVSTQYVSMSSTPDRVVIGTFTGEYMIDQDNKQYPVPANYASKSKLVEGDQLKLTITKEGSFIYKQIGPTPRKRAIANIVLKDGNYYAQAGLEVYRILTASITYFRLSPGDEVTILMPLSKKSEWSAIENVVSSKGGFQEQKPSLPSVDMLDQAIENVSKGSDLEEEDELKESKVEEDSDDITIQPW